MVSNRIVIIGKCYDKRLLQNIVTGLLKSADDIDAIDILENFNYNFHTTKLEGLFDYLLEHQSPEIGSSFNHPIEDITNLLSGENEPNSFDSLDDLFSN